MVDNTVLNPGLGGDVMRAKEVQAIKYQSVHVFNEFAASPLSIVNDFITLDGLGVTREMTGNYTGGGVGTQVFSLKPENGEFHVYNRVSIHMTSTGNANELFLAPEIYGPKAAGAKLTNGITLQYRRLIDDVVVGSSPNVIFVNRDWEVFLGGLTTAVAEDAGDSHYLRTVGIVENIVLGGSAADGGLYLALELSDDFSILGFDLHNLILTGRRMNADAFNRHYVTLDD